MKKTAKPKTLSIAAGIVFLFAAILSGIAITSAATELSNTPKEPFIYTEEDFYNYAEPTTYYRSNGNGGEPCDGYRIDYFTLCEDYEDYVDITERMHKSHYEGLESTLSFSIALTVAFILSGIGAFVARKKAFSIPFIIAQIGFFIAVIGILISLTGDPDEFHIIIVYALFAFLCSLNYIIPLSKNFKFKPKFAILSVLHTIINIALYILPAFLFIAMLNIDSFIAVPLALSYLPAIIAFSLCCANVRTRYKISKPNETIVAPTNYIPTTQSVTYAAHVAPVMPTSPVSQPQPTPTIQQPHKADEIKQYKELLDIGTITQEEFDAKKKQLLGL